MTLTRIHETDRPIDDAIALQQLQAARYFASGLVAGGAGITLTMLLTALTLRPASIIALRALGIVLLVGCFWFLRSGLIYQGLAVGRLATAGTAAYLL